MLFPGGQQVCKQPLGRRTSRKGGQGTNSWPISLPSQLRDTYPLLVLLVDGYFSGDPEYLPFGASLLGAVKVAQGGVVKGGRGGGGHLAAAPHKQGGFRSRTPGFPPQNSGIPARVPPWAGTGGSRRSSRAWAQGPSPGLSSPNPGLGGVKVGEEEQLQPLPVFLQLYRGKGVLQGSKQRWRRCSEGEFQQGHAAGPSWLPEITHTVVPSSSSSTGFRQTAGWPPPGRSAGRTRPRR